MTGTGENVDLITSIPSRLVRFGTHGASVGPASQEACAASWVQNGLRPRSLNAPQELDQIPTLAGVSSEPFVQENPVVAPDHPGPSLGNIFDVVAPDEPCAITNADVYSTDSLKPAYARWPPNGRSARNPALRWVRGYDSNLGNDRLGDSPGLFQP